MFSKLLFTAILALYSVNSLVINISDKQVNIISDAESIEKDVSLNSCDNRACNQQCLRLGFTGGVCVGDRCKCDNFKEHKVDDDSGRNGVSPRMCDNKACDQLCRRLGFKTGSCADGKCKCDIYKRQTYAFTASVVADDTEKSCYGALCYRMCQNAGFIGGVCISDECICYKSTASEDNLAMAYSEVCSPVACTDMCHRLNFIGGMCIGGNCKCY